MWYVHLRTTTATAEERGTWPAAVHLKLISKSRLMWDSLFNPRLQCCLNKTSINNKTPHLLWITGYRINCTTPSEWASSAVQRPPTVRCRDWYHLSASYHCPSGELLYACYSVGPLMVKVWEQMVSPGIEIQKAFINYWRVHLGDTPISWWICLRIHQEKLDHGIKSCIEVLIRQCTPLELITRDWPCSPVIMLLHSKPSGSLVK